VVGGQKMKLRSSRLLLHQNSHDDARTEGQQPNGRNGPLPLKKSGFK